MTVNKLSLHNYDNQHTATSIPKVCFRVYQKGFLTMLMTKTEIGCTDMHQLNYYA